MESAVKQKATTEIKKVDRLGRAVVSFIFSFIGLASFTLFCMAMETYSTSYDPNETGILVTTILTLMINLTSFFLGISARRSTSGRGLAIAAITISAIPLTIVIGLLTLSTILMFTN
ncbi:hypothetical protein [Paenibacillus sp. Marseille-Q4541]|uniref:hypothetical protein n=1 Tax=Paenibacillus sp. Marseille-Q4541 TaxID=2831522 RepID=UPI001BA8C619|nr:hypothetical protein [Paenibacillus sp. Marseille-Q4541]